MYPEAANYAAEISIKCSRHQLGIRTWKCLLCLLGVCENPVAPIKKISINIDKKCGLLCVGVGGMQNLDR